MDSAAVISARSRRRSSWSRTILVIGTVLLVGLPPVVVAHSYISSTSTGTLTANTTSTGGGDCGFNEAGSYDSAYIGSITGTQDPGNHLWTTMDVPVDVVASDGSSGYEYLEGEFYFGCYDIPTAGTWTATLSITPTSFSTASWYAVFITPDTGSTTSDSSSSAYWCNPTSSAQGGTSCSGSAVACGSYTPSVYLPVNTQKALTQGTSGNEWVYVNGAYQSAASTCGVNTVGPSGIALGATTNTMTYIEDIGFAFGNTLASGSISGTITLGYTVSA